MAKKTTLQLALAAAAFLAIPGLAQAQPKLLEKANELYQSSQFAKAAELYQQALDNPEKTGTASQQDYVKAKLAYCLRVNNKMEQAEALYADVVQDPETPAENYYHYAEILLGNGKYQEAKKWFNKFLAIEPGNEKAILMTRSCDLVPGVTPFFPNIEVTAFAHNSPADDNAPIQWKGGILFSSDRPQGSKMLKEKSGWTGRDYLNLYHSKLKADGSYADPQVFSPKLAELNKNLSNAAFSPDGNEIYFTRNADQLNQQNTYSLQLFKATGAGRWKNIQKLPICNPNFNYMHPAMSPDGNALFFVSNKSGGTGGTDIWMTYKKDGDWETPENLGSLVNTPFNEGFPFMDELGRLFFCSKGHTSFGGYDIFVTEMDHFGQWLPPRNLGRPINGPLDDVAIFVAEGGQSGMFTSSRDGADDDIYFFQVQPGATPALPQSETPTAASSTRPPQTARDAETIAIGEPPFQAEDPTADPSSGNPAPPLPPADPATAQEGDEAPALASQAESADTTGQEPTAEIREPAAAASWQEPSEDATLQAQATAAELPPAPADYNKAAEPLMPVESTPPPAGQPQAGEPRSPAARNSPTEAPVETAPEQPAQPGQPAAAETEALSNPPATAPVPPALPGQPGNPEPGPATAEPQPPAAPATPAAEPTAQPDLAQTPQPEMPAAPVAAAPAQPERPGQPGNPGPEAGEPVEASAPVATTPDKPLATPPSQPARAVPAAEPAITPATGKPAPPPPTNQGNSTSPAPAPRQVLEKAPVPNNQELGLAPAAGHPPSSLATQTEEMKMKKLGAFKDLAQKLEAGSTTPADRFRLDNATFDPNVWQLTPKVSLMLDRLAELMRQYPAIKIELSAHTESTGPEPLNLALSQNRAGIAQEYLVKDGIARERIVIKACGESMLLNHCTDDADCSREEHLVNQRLEVRILE